MTFRTRAGLLRGLRDPAGGAVLRGVPFAAPPFGPRRFRAPSLPVPWSGVRDATRFGPRPPQPIWGSDRPARPARAPDCLTLNVWTPDPTTRGLPVLVWIYGGAYEHGSADDPVLDGTRLAREGVVVVTFNYRVGFEGFGHLPDVPDNRGLLDQVAALRWVQDNITVVGGDPDNVTVCGSSAGGGSVVALATMPSARGLFRRCIAQSVPGLFYPPELASRVTRRVATAAGVSPRTEELAALAPQQLANTSAEVIAALEDAPQAWGVLHYATTPYFPIIDGEVLPASPFDALGDGAAADLDLLVGYNRDEYQMMLESAGRRGRQGMQDVFRAAVTLFSGGAAAEDYGRAYRGLAGPDLYSVLCSDWLFRMPTLDAADGHAGAGSVQGRTFAYEFAWPSPVAGGALGACHALEIPFVFGTLDTPFARAWLGRTGEPEEELSARMRAAWTAFAATGDPGWSSYRPGEALTRVWAARDSMVADPLAASRRIWRRHRPAHTPPALQRPG
ncbi:carboxylesterase/lipase family protein [Blastococcus mobilis]|uniref:carboxylesterase/lipase family protein n=1 Tax=Blastococcus mobilis TaxID=1938746 RepID=UPI001C3E7647|nr:carboxylesterase family protein [Blastococcus mobilis]